VAEGRIARGVLPVFKHVPGHGCATADSHEHLPVVDASREELEAYFPEGYADLAAIVSEVRRELQKLSLRVSGDTWRKAIDRDLLRLVEEGKRREAKDYLLVQLGAGICG
jgi:hypothetical protein